MVGTSSVFLVSVDDIGLQGQGRCDDRLPDIPFVTTGGCRPARTSRSRSRVPSWSARRRTTTRRRTSRRSARPLLAEEAGERNLHGVYIFGSDSKSPAIRRTETLGQLRAIGIKSDRRLRPQRLRATVRIHGDRPDDEEQGSTYAQCTGQYTCTVLLRKEASVARSHLGEGLGLRGQCLRPSS